MGQNHDILAEKSFGGAQKPISYAQKTFDSILEPFCENRIFGRFWKFWNFEISFLGPKKRRKTAKTAKKPSCHNLYRLGSKISKMATLTRRNFQNPIYFMSIGRFSQNPSKPSNTVLDAKRHKKSRNKFF